MSENIIVRMFDWWNGAMRCNDGLTAEAFAQFYTEDAQLVVNGQVRSRNLAEMAVHYQGVRSRCDAVEMLLPVEEAFACGDRAFVHCRTRAVIGGRTAAEEAMAYAVVRDGRMALLRVVSLSV